MIRLKERVADLERQLDELSGDIKRNGNGYLTRSVLMSPTSPDNNSPNNKSSFDKENQQDNIENQSVSSDSSSPTLDLYTAGSAYVRHPPISSAQQSNHVEVKRQNFYKKFFNPSSVWTIYLLICEFFYDKYFFYEYSMVYLPVKYFHREHEILQ
jgi:hypothetical protein